MNKDDLISRQAAIDFIDAGKYVNPNEPRWSDNEIVAFLQSRPSARQWILCSERMPKYEEKVLVCYCGQVRIGYLTDISKNSMWTLQGGSFPIFPIKHDSEKFVAWMPLPEVPEVEE